MIKYNSTPNIALIGGFTLASFHACWIVIVASGYAQPILDFIFKLHMLNSPFIVQPFSVLLSAELIALTFIIGAMYGVVFSLIRKSISNKLNN